MNIKKLNEALKRALNEAVDVDDTEIGGELKEIAEGESKQLYLSAENADEELMRELTTFCQALKAGEAVHVNNMLNMLEGFLDVYVAQAYDDADVGYTGDEVDYAYCTVRLATVLKEFAQSLGRTDIVDAINSNKVFQQCEKVAQKINRELR